LGLALPPGRSRISALLSKEQNRHGEAVQLPSRQAHHSYTISELSALIGAHKHTIARWIAAGLTTTDARRPLLIHGASLNPDGSFYDVHTPRYDFNDEILTLGAGYWVSLVQEELG
jgi:hypothetical protein